MGAVLCAKSEVLRAGILTPMQEASKGEIFVKEVGEKALGTVIKYIYTGELELGENPDIVDLAWAGNKYLLGGFMDLLTLRVQMMKELPGQRISGKSPWARSGPTGIFSTTRGSRKGWRWFQT